MGRPPESTHGASDDLAVDVSVVDDGVGGATRAETWAIGSEDRVEALGGTIRLVSPRGGGTSVHVTMPLDNP
jgi:signal transduction histidine kinase